MVRGRESAVVVESCTVQALASPDHTTETAFDPPILWGAEPMRQTVEQEAIRLTTLCGTETYW